MNNDDQAQPVAELDSETISTSKKNEPTAPMVTAQGAFVGLNEAKRLTGKSKDTILRHAEKGTISTTLNGQNRKVYQVVDLERVFGIATSATSPDEGASNHNDHQDQDEATTLKVSLLEEKLRHSEELNRIYKEQADRAAREAEDWKQQANQAMRMLTYQPQPVEQDQINQPQEPTPQPKRGLFGLFRGK
jgi:hypothetical protein